MFFRMKLKITENYGILLFLRKNSIQVTILYIQELTLIQQQRFINDTMVFGARTGKHNGFVRTLIPIPDPAISKKH